MKINWEENDSYRHKGSKINKHKYCKKNKQGPKQYGSHIYENGSVYCKLCGHIDKSKVGPNYNEDIGE